MRSKMDKRSVLGAASGTAVALALTAATLAPAAEADTVTVREAKPPTVTPRVITPAPTPQPESTPPADGGELIVGTTVYPEAGPLPGSVSAGLDPVPMPNLKPIPSLRDEGDLGAEIANLFLIMGVGGEYLIGNRIALALPATMRAQSDSPSEPNPLIDFPTEANLLPIPPVLKTLGGVGLVEEAIAAVTKSLAMASCGEHRVDDNGVAYCPK